MEGRSRREKRGVAWARDRGVKFPCVGVRGFLLKRAITGELTAFSTARARGYSRSETGARSLRVAQGLIANRRAFDIYSLVIASEAKTMLIYGRREHDHINFPCSNQ